MLLKKNINKKVVKVIKKVFLYLFMVVLFTTIVSAECSDEEISDFRDCYGVTSFDGSYWLDCYHYDYNTDEVVNLVDLGVFSRDCYSKPVENPVVRTFSSGGLSFFKVKEYLFGEILLIDTNSTSDQVSCGVSLVLSDKFNESYSYNGFVPNPYGKGCIKVT